MISTRRFQPHQHKATVACTALWRCIAMGAASLRQVLQVPKVTLAFNALVSERNRQAAQARRWSPNCKYSAYTAASGPRAFCARDHNARAARVPALGIKRDWSESGPASMRGYTEG